VALIGRVVPIKDVKTYIRACAHLVKRVPDAVCYVLGPTDADEPYYRACQELVEKCGLSKQFQFCGMVRLTEYLGRIDVAALTSISEAQPLVILECGAAGIPTVATDVGACREMIEGRADESPRLGPGGRVARIGSPEMVGQGLAELLLDEPLRQACGEAMRRRVGTSYSKEQLERRYAGIYAELLAQPTRAREGPWQV
jgi:glycosyltransferase involved in cell wall biosynthesis